MDLERSAHVGRGNPRFVKRHAAAGAPIPSGEETIMNFDIQAVLTRVPPYKVLHEADRLARASAEGGFSYRQPAWNNRTEDENLRVGM